MIKTGDTFTFAGFFPLIPNPDRRWWQFWKPRRVPDMSKFQQFKVTE